MPNPRPPDDDFQLDLHRLRIRISKRSGFLIAVLTLAIVGRVVGLW